VGGRAAACGDRVCRLPEGGRGGLKRGSTLTTRTSRPPSPGKHRAKLTRRGRWIAGGLVLLAGFLTISLISGEEPAEVTRVCARPENLRHYRGITLQPGAMSAFRQAERRAGTTIEVVESFRSCRQQAMACQRICGNRQGCPGTCAPPGLSWHQRAMAIDISQAALDTPGVVGALRDSGWCQSSPDTDPGHFSWGGCH
jgi:hypothetical protein